MRKKWLIGLAVLGVLSVVLMIALASVGSQLDQTRLDRDDLEQENTDISTEADSLRADRDALKTERDALKTQVDEQLRTIEQLKSESGRSGQSAPAQ